MTYLNDLFSATRHRAELDGTFLTARCMSDAEKLVRAHRVVSTDLNGMELLRDGDDENWILEDQDDEEHDNDEDEDDDDDDDDENSDEQWQTVEADEFSSFGITFPKSLNSKKQPQTTVSSNSKSKTKTNKKIITTNNNNNLKNGIPKLEVTEINIARIFPRCVSHRLRVRDGPREEVVAASLLFGATFDWDDEVDDAGTNTGREVYMSTYEERPTVKDVLVSILSEV